MFYLFFAIDLTEQLPLFIFCLEQISLAQRKLSFLLISTFFPCTTYFPIFHNDNLSWKKNTWEYLTTMAVPVQRKGEKIFYFSVRLSMYFF